MRSPVMALGLLFVAIPLAAQAPAGAARPGMKPFAEVLGGTAAAEVSAVPGLDGMAAGSNLPYQDPDWAATVLVPGDAPDEGRRGIASYVVTPGYFEVLRIPLRMGRALSPSDNAAAPMAIVQLVDKPAASESAQAGK